MEYITWFKDCSYKNKNIVGGKCSSLGELYNVSKNIGFSIADGFAITTHLYDDFLEQNNLSNSINDIIKNIDVDDINQLEEESLKIRKLIYGGNFTQYQIDKIEENYKELCILYNNENTDVAIRSSSIAEDSLCNSFAGMMDTYLNNNQITSIIENIKNCFASLFCSRAISYRCRNNVDLKDIKMSVAVQKMIRSDIGSAGVCFSIDTESGYDKSIIINSSFGLGESVVAGTVKPDEIIIDKRILNITDSDPIIYKKIGDKNSKIIYSKTEGTITTDTTDEEKINFSISDNNAKQLAKYVFLLEEYYSNLFNKKIGIDCEFALDGIDGNIYIVQVRPETYHSNNDTLNVTNYILDETSEKILTGIAISDKISSGKIKIISSMKDYKKFNKGDILVTEFTSPDFESLMKISSGLITMKGGRTSHAAIVSRELGLTSIVGVGENIKKLKDDDEVTISCAEGEIGVVYKNKLKYHIEQHTMNKNLKLPIKVMLNVADPQSSFKHSLLPNDGSGLVRIEFIINNHIKIHPNALFNYPNINDLTLKQQICDIIGYNYKDGKSFYIEKLAQGIGKIASSLYPNDVLIRLSDFKSNEYKNLIGGELYEPIEENPMIGFRGASRYYSPFFEDAFSLECYAIKYAIEKMKLDNIIVMIPFCRTPEECKLVLNTMEKYGLKRGTNGLQVYIMCELPSNVLEADEFSELIDGVSIGGNDMLQMVLGLDRDSEFISHLADDKNKSYRRIISMAIDKYKKNNKKVGFCGQQPSDSVEFARFLINEGIDSISVTPDSCLKTIQQLQLQIE
jgi:pyruvate,water dikinase